MGLYVLLVLAILLLYFPIKKIFKKKYKLVYCVLVGIFLFSILACRDISMGVDLKKLYIPYFRKISQFTNFSQLFDFCKQVDTEILYYFINYIVLKFTTNYHIYLAIVSLPFIFLISRYIYKYSNNSILSFLIFISLNYYCYAFSALRHTMAAALLLLSYDFIIKKQKWKFILCVLIAFLFHRSALIFLIAYPLCNLKINIKQFFLIFLSLALSLLLKDSILKLIFTIFNDGHFSHYKDINSNLGLTFFFINLLIYLFMCYFLRNNDSERENQVNLNLQCLCVCFSALVPMFSEMLRISFFFGIFACCGLPNAISNIKYKNKRNLLNCALGVIFIFYFLNFTLNNNNLVPYVSFFN